MKDDIYAIHVSSNDGMVTVEIQGGDQHAMAKLSKQQALQLAGLLLEFAGKAE